jgi:hypothetical protein
MTSEELKAIQERNTHEMERRQADVTALLAEVERLRTLLLQFLGSLTLCDHMGDVSDDMDVVMKQLDLGIEWDDLGTLGDALGKLGITTLYGTRLVSEKAK